MDSGLIPISAYQHEGEIVLRVYNLPDATPPKFFTIELKDGAARRVAMHGVDLKDCQSFYDFLSTLRTGSRDDVIAAFHRAFPLPAAGAGGYELSFQDGRAELRITASLALPGEPPSLGELPLLSSQEPVRALVEEHLRGIVSALADHRNRS